MSAICITGQDWLVAVAEPQRHELACKKLTEAEFQVFMPLVLKSVIVRGRHVKVAQPLFGRYFFVRLTEAWRKIRAVRGISGVLLVEDRYSEDRTPHVVKDHKLAGLRGEKPVPQTRFMLGQQVTPQVGAFKGIVGTYGGLSIREREKAFFDLFGRQVEVEFKNSTDLIAA